MEKVTIVRALSGIWRRLELLKRIYGRFPSAYRIDEYPTLGNAPVKVNPDPIPPPPPGTCGALVGLYHHIGSSLSPQYVGDSRIFFAFVLRNVGH